MSDTAKFKGEVWVKRNDFTPEVRKFIVADCEHSVAAMCADGIPAIGDANPHTEPQRWKCWEKRACCIAPGVYEVQCLYSFKGTS